MTTNANQPMTLARLTVLSAVLGAAVLTSACAPVMLGSAVMGSALSFTDRRTAGTQIEDEAIELKALPRINEAVGDRGHVNTTSYNRTVLITGEVATEADKAAVERAVARIENVKATVNELAVAGKSSIGARSNDAILTSKIKAAYVDAKDLQANAIKVVTERGVAYLMGRVTEREAARAAELARATSGVTKVVRVFEILTESELAELQPKTK